VRKKITAPGLAAGALLFWLPGSIAVAILVPMTSYLGSWTLLAGSIALLVSLVPRGAKEARPLSGIAFLASAVLATFLWVPVIYISYLAGSPQLILTVAMAALWIGSMMPILDWITTPNRWILSLAALFVGIGYLITGHFLVGKETSPPLVNPVGYWLDANENEAYWIGFSEELDERQRGLLVDPVHQSYTEIFPEAPDYPVLANQAPLLDQQGPQLQVVEDIWVSSRRSAQVQITTSMKDRVYVIIPGEVPVLSITVPNNEKTELPLSKDEFVLRFDGTPAQGLELGFDLERNGTFQILVVEERTGLPSFPGLNTQPQAGTMRTPGEFYQGIPTDFTAVYRAFTVSEAE
jgi:hypothetical protein